MLSNCLPLLCAMAGVRAVSGGSVSIYHTKPTLSAYTAPNSVFSAKEVAEGVRSCKLGGINEVQLSANTGSGASSQCSINYLAKNNTKLQFLP